VADHRGRATGGMIGTRTGLSPSRDLSVIQGHAVCDGTEISDVMPPVLSSYVPDGCRLSDRAGVLPGWMVPSPRFSPVRTAIRRTEFFRVIIAPRLNEFFPCQDIQRELRIWESVQIEVGSRGRLFMACYSFPRL